MRSRCLVGSRTARALTGVTLVFTTASLASAALTPTKLWSIGPGTPDARAYLTTGNTERGIAYNAATNHVYVVSRAADAATTPANLKVAILNAASGAQVGFLPTDATINNTGIGGTTFLLNKIGVSDDGKIYAANLTTTAAGTGALKVYRWDTESSAPTNVLNQTGLSLRFGDTMDVRGSGTGTQMIFGENSTTGANVDIVTTADGNAFAGSIIPVSGAANGDFRHGITFAENNIFYGKPNASATNMRRVQFNLAPASATVVNSYSTADFDSSIGPIDVDPVHHWLAALVQGVSNKLQIYDIADPSVTPVLLGELPLDPQPGNANPNATGDVRFSPDGYTIYVMQTNNALTAVAVPEPGTLGVLALGTLGLVNRRRPRRFARPAHRPS